MNADLRHHLGELEGVAVGGAGQFYLGVDRTGCSVCFVGCFGSNVFLDYLVNADRGMS